MIAPSVFRCSTLSVLCSTLSVFVQGGKFLGVRIFWLAHGMLEMQTAFLACTIYSPPHVDPDWAFKRPSDWLLEYVLAVLLWYGITPEMVAGATSDAGSDCKRAFNVCARTAHGWTWDWYFHSKIL